MKMKRYRTVSTNKLEYIYIVSKINRKKNKKRKGRMNE
jgi:hypothetical protein